MGITAKDLQQKVTKDKQAVSYRPKHTPPTELWHPCERKLVLLRQIPLQLSVAQRYLDIGNEFEEIAVKRLSNIVKIKNYRYPIVNEELDVKGIIDVVLEDGNFIEIKSTATDELILNIDTMMQNQLTKKYYYQMQAYMLLMQKDFCILYVIDRRNGEDYFFDIERNNAVIEEIIERAKHVKEHLQKGTLPNKTEVYDLCKSCPFFEQCYPDVAKNEIKSITVSPDLQALIEKYYAIKDKLKKYKQVEETLKEQLKSWDTGVYLIGDKTIKIMEYQRTFYNIPEEIKNQYAETKVVKKIQL